MIKIKSTIPVELTVLQLENLLEDTYQAMCKIDERIRYIDNAIPTDHFSRAILQEDAQNCKKLLEIYQATSNALLSALRIHDPNHRAFKEEKQK